ncbi:MAG: GspH/FimT family protein [Planctomycetota bacterium]|jgi:type II secretory pathway pseudopilin PulG|nr:GspH/FimT family protein [Planctomycetota bacterium]MDP6763096.1 GspH/FimT family protein [Planctomycetota bacterium]MDP6990894.1 GspH/FimT family protein [Planctomycetota bacterium]
MTTQPSKRPGGVNIVGLAVALLCVSALALLAIPGFFARAEVSLDNAALLLAADLRAAQNEAVLGERELRVVFAPDGTGYGIVDARERPIPHPTGVGEFVRSYSRDGVFEGVRITDRDLGPELRITFDAHGFARSVGTVVLELDGERRTVEVEAASGAVRIEGLGRPWSDGGD